MAFKHFVLAAALLVIASSTAAAASTHPIEAKLTPDRYGVEKAKPATELPATEATVHTPQVYAAAAANDMKTLQKRSYQPWSAGQRVQLPAYQSITVWKPPVYQLSRPYYIPIYGAPGRVPIYYPPQPLLLNAGAPQDNPIRPFQGPEYLPPSTERSTTMKIDNRNVFDDDEDEDAPIWGGDAPPAASQAGRPLKTSGSEVFPTRPPKVPETAFPPLLHNINSTRTNQLAAMDDISEEFEIRPVFSESQRPPPAVQAVQSTPRPTASAASSSQVASGPSNCVWAIVSCCSTSSVNVPQNCFEQRGCSGPFWDASPCDSEFARSAIASALNYYSNQ